MVGIRGFCCSQGGAPVVRSGVYPLSPAARIMVPPLRRVTFGKSAPKVTKNALLLVGPFLRQGSFTPVSLRGPAPNGHPCPDGALAASMRLGPLRETCVQPAPKSRLVSSERYAYEDQKQIKSRSTASRLKPVLLDARDAFVGLASAGKRPVCSPSLLRCDAECLPG